MHWLRNAGAVGAASHSEYYTEVRKRRDQEVVPLSGKGARLTDSI